MGPTRSGKSTFINSILGATLAKEGEEESIYSTTRVIDSYSGKVSKDMLHLFPGMNEVTLTFIDTMGFGDATVLFDDAEINELIKAALLRNIKGN